MADENIRIYDLAKELSMTNKDLIEKINEILKISVKSHSSVLTTDQVRRVKLALAEKNSPEAQAPKKPKAFIVKKAKKPQEGATEAPKEEPTPVIAIPKSDIKIGKIEQPKIFTSTHKPPKPVKKVVEEKEEKPVEKVVEKPVEKAPAPRYERPQNLGRVIPPSEKRLAEAKEKAALEKKEKVEKKLKEDKME